MNKFSQQYCSTNNFLPERLIQFRKLLPALGLGSAAMMLVLTILADEIVPANWLNLWIAYHVAIVIVVMAFDQTVVLKAIKTGRALTDKKYIRRTYIGYIVAFFFIAIPWGSSAILFVDSNCLDCLNVTKQFLQTGIVITIYVTVLGIASTVGLLPFVYLSITIPFILPLLIVLFTHSNDQYLYAATGGTICWSLAFYFAWTAYKTANETFRLQYINKTLIKDLELQVERVNKMTKDKSRFLAAASHDIRQPLHTMGLFLSILQTETNPQKHPLIIENLQKSIDAQSEILNSLLDISRIDSGTVVAINSHFKFSELLTNLEDEFKLEAQRKQLAFNIESCDAVVLTDPFLLKNILRNLISNAIRHTDSGSVDIRTSQNAQYLLVNIVDTGPGIPDAEKEHIFSEFYQLNNDARDRNKGLGLGLAIVKRLCTLLNIEIQLPSTNGFGSNFELKLPIGLAHKLPKEKQLLIHDITQPIAGKHILVIDDDIDVVKAMQSLIESWSCQFTGVYSVEEALQVVKSGIKPDFIVSDYRLPNQTGINCIALLREALLTETPALLVSGDTDPKILKEIKSYKIPLLHKPVKPVQLRIAITRLLTSVDQKLE